MSCDHVSILVPPSKVEPLIEWLLASLGHLGFKEHLRPVENVIGLGVDRPWFWLFAEPSLHPKELDEATILAFSRAGHVAFAAKTEEQVQQFHEAALKAGGTCNGPPGPRPEYHPHYYGAFVRDPAIGLNFEVVSHGPYSQS